MSDRYQFSSRRWLFRGVLFTILGLLLLARIGYSQNQLPGDSSAVLQGSLQLIPDQSNLTQGPEVKIQPGTGLKLAITVENKGQKPSSEGQLYIRYAFAKPLNEETESIIFETEKKPLPSIQPSQSLTITFDTPHQTPSILDFVRYDWSIREYQAIAMINQKENIIGTLALTFSAYYYPGIKKELPTQIP